MGHTEKTHAEFYEMPVDIYQTAKVSKLLLMMEKGKLPIEYKGKSLDEIEIDLEYPEENDNLVSSENISTEQSDKRHQTFRSEINVSRKANTNKRDNVEMKGSITKAELPGIFEGTDSDDERPKSKNKTKITKRGWSQYEVDLLRSTFENEIKNKLYPTSKAIQDFSSKNGINRSITVIKAKIQHLVKLRK